MLQGAIYHVLRRCPLSSNVLSDLGNPLVQSRMNRLVANRDKEIDPVILGGGIYVESVAKWHVHCLVASLLRTVLRGLEGIPFWRSFVVFVWGRSL